MISDLSKELGVDLPWLMGIINATPDSFSDGGKFTPEEYNHRLEELFSQGAHIVDVGGEATGPNSKPIGAEVEISRIRPLFESLPKKYFVSVDTFKSTTADFALQHGARMVNDISALRFDPEMPAVVKNYNAYVVLMHSKESASSPHASEAEVSYSNVVQNVAEFLLKRCEFALKAGIDEKRIVLDPGMGRFISKNAADSWELIERFSELRDKLAPFPLMIAASRKGFLGGKLEERDPSSQLVSLIACTKGSSIIRTHNVSMAKNFVQTAKATGLL